MRKLFIVLGVICLAAAVLGFESPDNRLTADQRAKDAFLKLRFFTEGRGMHLVPGLIEVFENYGKTKVGLELRDRILHQHWGFNVINHWPVGLFDEEYKGMHIGALGCVACHSGTAAGQFIVGLGNKNIDVLRIGKDTGFIESVYKQIHPGERTDKDYLAVRDSALEFAHVLSNERIGNMTQGMVPVSFIRYWFYKQAGLPLPDDMTRGAVKIPFLWGYGEKRKVGQFSDGYGNGNLPGWAIAVELTAGQDVQTVRGYRSKIQDAENLFSDLLPPPYPFEIDLNKAGQGKLVFEKTCSHCHGTYERDEQGFPIYEKPKFIPWSKVRTDDDRLASNTALFSHLVETNPLNDIIQHTDLGPGFFAPRLVGVWSRFPYLHNGSIPNVASLLTPPAKRPKTFSVRDAGELYRFDKINLGLTLGHFEDDNEVSTEELEFTLRTTYDTTQVGHSNQGHPFGLDLSREEKSQIIEYLKTL